VLDPGLESSEKRLELLQLLVAVCHLLSLPFPQRGKLLLLA
jgi:hypothetical protein